MAIPSVDDLELKILLYAVSLLLVVLKVVALTMWKSITTQIKSARTAVDHQSTELQQKVKEELQISRDYHHSTMIAVFMILKELHPGKEDIISDAMMKYMMERYPGKVKSARMI